MAKLSQFRFDSGKEVEGVWVDAGQGLMLKLARLNNPRYREYMRKHGRPMRHKLRKGTWEDAEVEALAIQATAETILLDWKNLEDDKGKEIPFSSKKAAELMKELPDFFDLVQELANDASYFRTESIEEAKGNSQASSNGS